MQYANALGCGSLRGPSAKHPMTDYQMIPGPVLSWESQARDCLGEPN
jgi:hypothetical protein